MITTLGMGDIYETETRRQDRIQYPADPAPSCILCGNADQTGTTEMCVDCEHTAAALQLDERILVDDADARHLADLRGVMDRYLAATTGIHLVMAVRS